MLNEFETYITKLSSFKYIKTVLIIFHPFRVSIFRTPDEMAE
jgi:hypothetical protein